MKLKGSHILALGICAAAVAWVLSGYVVPGERVRAAGPAPVATEAQPRPVRVRVSVAESRPDVLRLFGQTQASRRVDLRAEIDGRVAEVLIERGAPVAAGAVIARLAVEDRAARLAEARALLAQRQAELDAARTLARSGHRAELGVAENQARFEAGRAMVARMEIDLQRTVIRAPFDGVIETRAVELGSYLKAADPIATIVDLTPLRIVGHVSERDVSRVAVGAQAQARLLDNRTVEGVIAYVATVADTATRTFKVELEVPNADGRIVEGLTAELIIPVGSTVAHRISPAILNLDDQGRVGVKIVDEAGLVAFLPVRVVAASPDVMWVEGLPERVTLIVVGQDFVNPGQRVRPVPEDAGAPAPRQAQGRS